MEIKKTNNLLNIMKKYKKQVKKAFNLFFWFYIVIIFRILKVKIIFRIKVIGV